MLYAFKQNDTYIGGERESSDQGHRAYKYVKLLKQAKRFCCVSDAINWLERTAYRNGELKSLFNGCLQLIRVKATEVEITYKEMGAVE